MLPNKSFQAGHDFSTEVLTLQPVLSIGTLECRAVRSISSFCLSRGLRKPGLPSFLKGVRSGFSDFHQVAL